MPQFVPKLSHILRLRGPPKWRSDLLRSPGSNRDIFTVTCVMEQRDFDRVWSIRRFIADEDPLFHKSFLDRIFDRDPKRVSMDKLNLTSSALQERQHQKQNDPEVDLA